MRSHREVAMILNRHLARSAREQSFDPLVDGIREALEAAGLAIDRVQLPMSRAGGFRHPTLGLVLATWSRDHGFRDSDIRTHEQLNALTAHGVVGTPFEDVVLHGAPFTRIRLADSDGGYALLGGLRDAGYVDYCAVGLPMPFGDPQPLSIAGQRPFPDDVGELLAELSPLLALAVYGAYRSSQASQLARVYIGRDAGPSVLDGEIQRGSTRRVNAGILFCDMRGFTSLSEQLGADAVVAVVNDVFQIVADAADGRGGEILKFIGDAMLLTFAEVDSEPALATALVETTREAVQSVQQFATKAKLPIALGFGGHIGEVVRGNIGATERLDYTVMGPAVNLASRLEGMCRPLQAGGVFSSVVAAHRADLRSAGNVDLKGFAEPQPIWVLD